MGILERLTIAGGVAFGAVASAAPPQDDILLKHSPINPLAGEVVTYSTRATSISGIGTIGINYTVFRIECVNGNPTLTDEIDVVVAGAGQGPNPPTVVEFQLPGGPKDNGPKWPLDQNGYSSAD